jgi:opacity protein-like surface antigen
MSKSSLILAVTAALFVSTGSAFAARAATQNATAEAPGSAVIGTVESDVRMRNVDQTQRGEHNKQALDAGSIVSSSVIGGVNTEVNLRNMGQSQEGTDNTQDASFATIKNSSVIGTVNSSVDAKNITQDQKGEHNDQAMSAGSIR